MTPPSLATRHSLDYILAALPRPAAQILEVGCGDGDLAEALGHEGHRVTAIDQAEEAVQNSRRKGVNALLARWPDFDPAPDGPRFDAVLFTRSLHHMDDLPAAIEKAHALIKPGGVLLVEDFAFGETPLFTMQWFKNRLERLATDHKIAIPENSFCDLLVNSLRPEQVWYHDHLNHIHPLGRMYREILVQFDQCHLEHAPYLYRYVLDMVPPTPDGAATLQHLFDGELALRKKDNAFLVGRRIMAQKP